jgi:carboxymethylenebutenolidase
MSQKAVAIVAVAFGAVVGAAAARTFAPPAGGAAPQGTLTSGDQERQLPPGETRAKAYLAASPRHGEWVMIATGSAPTDSLRAFIVYPERSTKAPVVVVVHEIFGLTPWVRSVADQLAAEGFIAIAPDLLTAKNLPGGPEDGPPSGAATAAIGTITPEVYQAQLAKVAQYGMALPAATQRYGVIGFCWGGHASYAHAITAPDRLVAAVGYYPGTPSPTADEARAIRVPVLGMYGGSDARVTATAPGLDSMMHALGKSFAYHVYDGAGHGFLRAQDTREANAAAAKQAWPITVAFLKKYLEQ